MVGNENGALKSPSDMLRLSDSANKSHFERNPQPLSLGLDGEPKTSNGVLASDPTADRSNLPGYKASLNLIALFLQTLVILFDTSTTVTTWYKPTISRKA